MSYHVKLIKGGKVAIPAELRRAFGMRDGDTLVMEREGEGLVIKTYAQVVREVQQEFKQLAPDGDTVDKFLADRRRDWGEE